MKFSTGFPGVMRYPPEEFTPGRDHWQDRLTVHDFQRIARTAEDLGYDSLNVSEHLVMPKDLAVAMGAYWVDAFTVMSFIAGATTRIRVNSSVIVMPYHHPVQFAKAVATLDVLSGGRVTITVGAGMARGEFAALGVPFEQRGRITDEYLDAMKVLWTEASPSSTGGTSTSPMCCSNRSRSSNRTRRCGLAAARWPRCAVQRAWATGGCRAGRRAARGRG